MRAHKSRLVRYSATSVVALAVSETTLLALYATGTLNATSDGFIANLAGTFPSYLMSRYWIWKDSERQRVGRQVVMYWMISLASMMLTSFATGGIARIAPDGRVLRLFIVGSGFFIASFILWVAKYLVYQRLIFVVPRPEQHGDQSCLLEAPRESRADSQDGQHSTTTAWKPYVAMKTMSR